VPRLASQNLSKRCTVADPLARPTFAAIQEELAALQTLPELAV